MASRIKARECRDHALVVSARTPLPGVSMKLGIDRRAEYYTAVTLTIGVAVCITIKVGKIVRGHDFSLKFTFLPPITVSTTRALPRDDVRLFLSLKEPEWLT
ncbi:hypothetical protein [Hafnia paralvei]|nr:hypothetical protein [Hafnia paralvei]